MGPGSKAGATKFFSRAKAKFVEPFQQIYPTGKSLRFIGIDVKTLAKIFLFSRNTNQSIFIGIPSHSEGALRNVPARGGDAVDADGASDEGA
jgi:hypothetical protein